jgi:hypothetical protein
MSAPDEYMYPDFGEMLEEHQRWCLEQRVGEAIEALRVTIPEVEKRYGRLDESSLELRKALEITQRARHMLVARQQREEK